MPGWHTNCADEGKIRLLWTESTYCLKILSGPSATGGCSPSSGRLLAAGILIFAYPNRGYLALATLFGWLMFLSGILEAALSAMNRHFVTGRGWMAVGGLIEIILGLILIFNVSLSEITLRSYWVSGC